VCRYDEQQVVDRDGPTKTLPNLAEMYWLAIPVPSDKFTARPDLIFCHRLVYRARVEVPAALAGRSFFMRFPSINMIASLFVNGRFCGWTKAMRTLWECDITSAIKPGETNEICVVIKDAYYAFSPKKSGKDCRLFFNTPLENMDKNWVGQHFDFPVMNAGLSTRAGILSAPSLITAGNVYTADVFCKPSVKEKKLALEITLRNPTSAEQKVQVRNETIPLRGDKPEKIFAPAEVVLAAGQEQVLNLSETWETPKLWWPDDPQMYHLVTTVLRGGKVVDVRRTPFGFREWDWSGKQFKLNGVPWQLFADTTHGDGGKTRESAEAAVAFWKKSGQNMWRFWDEKFGGMERLEALAFMDQHGIIVRASGIFDGQGANYLHGLSDNPELYANWLEQLKAWVRAERNHPSILIWSLENEITFINSRNLGQAQKVEPEIAKAAKAVMALDPTRPVMVDGGNCLLDESLPVNGVHYPEVHWREYPDEAYTLA
ncbi:MAG: hypothetical protein N3A66_09620, partial [Planctomycetota bacterium]|nr:hypothetical protein [Planctomycetota bacterium]